MLPSERKGAEGCVGPAGSSGQALLDDVAAEPGSSGPTPAGFARLEKWCLAAILARAGLRCGRLA